MQIWKYAISQQGQFTLEIPRRGRILDVQSQHGQPVFWVLVDPQAKPETRTFEYFGTGWDIQITPNMEYIGTFQLSGGSLIFHLFEYKENNVPF